MTNVSDRVFVLNSDKSPAMPCFRGRAWQLLKTKRAAVYRLVPLTIILKTRLVSDTQPVALKFDPGSKTTGIAVVANETVVFAANLEHRGAAIKKLMEIRKAVRLSRRTRKTRYRAARFANRSRPAGWLQPSLRSRVDNVGSWASKIVRFVPVTSIEVETVRFDMQKMQDPAIAGLGYQQGTLAGYEIREYLLEKFAHTCAYCDARNVPFEIEHVRPRSKGGSNRISNLAIACHKCNEAKGSLDVSVFITDPKRLSEILRRCKAPLGNAAAVNSTRTAIANTLRMSGLPVSLWSGGRTKMNRVIQGYEKDHWVDAACVGESGATVRITPTLKPLLIKATGRGSRQMCRVDKYGFPRSAAKSVKRVNGFQTGDLVRLTQPTGIYRGTHVGSVSVRARGQFDIKFAKTVITSMAKNFTLIQRTNGYQFAA